MGHGHPVAHGIGGLGLPPLELRDEAARAHPRQVRREPSGGHVQRILQGGAGEPQHHPAGAEHGPESRNGRVGPGGSGGKLRVEQGAHARELLGGELAPGELQQQAARRGLLLEVVRHERTEPMRHVREERGGYLQLACDGREPLGGGHRVQPVLHAAQIGTGHADAARQVAQAQSRIHTQQAKGGSQVHGVRVRGLRRCRCPCSAARGRRGCPRSAASRCCPPGRARAGG